MSEEIFRKKSLDKIKSPENLNDYVRVSNPGVWLLLISAIALLAGACVWGVFGRLDVAAETSVYVQNGECRCLCRLDESVPDTFRIAVGMTVTFDDCEGVIESIEEQPEGHIGILSVKEPPADGLYTGRIITERIRPISFVLN